MKLISIFFKSFFLLLFFFSNYAFSNTLNKIQIFGNDRISDETIKLFISINIDDEINDSILNKILKDLYETDFFKDINLNFDDQTLLSIEGVGNKSSEILLELKLPQCLVPVMYESANGEGLVLCLANPPFPTQKSACFLSILESPACPNSDE